MSSVDSVLAARRLQFIGYTSKESIKVFGRLKAVTPLINLPATLAYALAASLVPVISEAKSKGRLKVVQSKSILALKLILIIGFASAAGLNVLASPILLMLYGTAKSAYILKILAFAVIFLTLQQACTGILQGLGQTKIPVTNLFIGGLVKLVLNYYLISIPGLNISGAAVSSVVAYAVASYLNVKAVCKYANIKIEWSHMIIKPFIATGLMALLVSFSYSSLTKASIPNTIATLGAIVIGGGSFGVGLLITQCFSEAELNAIPYFGPPFIKFAGKLRLLRKE